MRSVYNDTLQKFDENLLKAEKALKLLSDMTNKGSIKAQARRQELFEALPKIGEALDTLNKGMAELTTGPYSDRLPRLQKVLTAGEPFDKETPKWCVMTYMREDPEHAGEAMHVKSVQHLVKSIQAASGVAKDHHGPRHEEFDIRTVEESGINEKPSVAAAALESNRKTGTLTKQSQKIFDDSIKLFEDNLPRAQELCSELEALSAEERHVTHGRRAAVELMQKLTRLREGMTHLAHGDHAFLEPAFGNTKRAARLLALLTAGSSFEEPRGGVLKLMAEDEEHLGQSANQAVVSNLIASYKVAAAVVSSSTAVSL
eukprot:CAMPEP_0170633234 /NCGR_PEP_ID=MMETSP0224-20130122/35840_1 /TAXON_ID=285029 /ORGANISM="Togula jolla, Strain CCCM 725" /LENGTH=314 /DNA_ID=CAMNT_0010962175 /DNA_START=42 /DNA_END=987 /DNA_ORIENTATION=+